jgi:hypothetical protein
MASRGNGSIVRIAQLACFGFADLQMPMSGDAARFQQQAQECRQQAERARTPLDKQTWLRLAEEWSKLAQAAERQTA